MRVKTLQELADAGKLSGKRVLIRSDLNAPHDESGRITDETRLTASVPAIQMALKASAAVMVVSHLGRPKEGVPTEAESLIHVADRLSELLGTEMPLVRDWVDGVTVEPGHVVILENCRFNVGEKKNNEDLARKYAALCDVYVNDAFGTSHRAEATTEGVAHFAKCACAGPLLAREIEALTAAVEEARHPLMAIVAGSKVSTKLTILNHLASTVDRLVVGGGIANTFLFAKGFPIGKSLAEPDLVPECLRVLKTLEEKHATMPLPVDVVVSKTFSAEGPVRVCSVSDVADDEMILDIGPKSREELDREVRAAKTIVWNGPVGVFEMEPFAGGTKALADSIAAATDDGAFSIAGGGDTVSAVKQFGIADRVSYISTGGGAFLEFLEGKTLPAVAALEARADD